MHLKSFTIAILAFIFTSISLAFTKEEGDKETYRAINLKVLNKKISHDALIHIMKSFNEALGVKCSFCHAKNAAGDHLDFASDANYQKNTARYMMRMTNDINKRHFKHAKNAESYVEISCITCHNGHEEAKTIRIETNVK
jgi:hypothetical protein